MTIREMIERLESLEKDFNSNKEIYVDYDNSWYHIDTIMPIECVNSDTGKEETIIEISVCR